MGVSAFETMPSRFFETPIDAPVCSKPRSIHGDAPWTEIRAPGIYTTGAPNPYEFLGFCSGGGLHLCKVTRVWTAAAAKPEELTGIRGAGGVLPGMNTWLQKYMALGIFSKRISATIRAAIGRIRTILWGSKAGPWGHMLCLFWAPGAPKN